MDDNRHVDPLQLVEYARGGLSRTLARSVRAHCMRCVECGDQLAAILLLRERANLGSASSPWRWQSVAAVAAAVVLAVALGWALVGNGAADAAAGALASDEADEAGAPVAPVAPLWSPREDPVFLSAVSFVAELEGTAVRVADGASAEAGLVRAALFAGRYEEAADLAADSDIDPNITGLALYLAGRPAEARAVLEPIVTPPGPGFQDAEPWVRFATVALAASQLELGDPTAARRLLSGWELPPAGAGEQAGRTLARFRGQLEQR